MLCSLICCSNVLAAQAPITCPATLTCNYAAGTCDLPAGQQWYLEKEGAYHPFVSANLSQIYGYISYARPHANQQKETRLDCEYEYGKIYGRSDYIGIYTIVKKLTGVNWVYSGFGNSTATCSSSANPATCAAE